MADVFDGMRIAITGGTSGLGLALVRELSQRGARVAFVARTRERVAQVAQENRGTHGIVGDVSSKNDIYPMAIQITGELAFPVPFQVISELLAMPTERALEVREWSQPLTQSLEPTATEE